jgi:multiple sugar transport system permease protein/N,N'-diacetylchitobiose transport system permease protein
MDRMIEREDVVESALRVDEGAPMLTRERLVRELRGTLDRTDFGNLGVRHEGKVRDSYVDGDVRTIVTTDRLSVDGGYRFAPNWRVYAGALAVGLFSAFPFLWMVLTSLKPGPEILTAVPVFWPSEFILERYGRILTGDFALYLRNSLIVATGTAVLSVTAAAMGGWVLARFRIPLRRYLVILVLSAQMFPVVELLIPIFLVMRNLGLLGTYTGLIVAYLSFTTPLVLWILRGFFKSIPIDLEEAALVDGATRAQAFRRIVLPLALPGIAATATFGFISAWNEFMFALTFTLNSPEMHTSTVALRQFVGRDMAADWGMIMAFSVVMTLPVIVLFLFAHKRMTEGLVAGATKG